MPSVYTEYQLNIQLFKMGYILEEFKESKYSIHNLYTFSTTGCVHDEAPCEEYLLIECVIHEFA